MTFIGDDLDDVAYDFLGYANELLHNLDISDEFEFDLSGNRTELIALSQGGPHLVSPATVAA